MPNENKDLAASINELLSQNKNNLNDVTSESNSFQDLPEGYYLCSVKETDITESKASQQPMVKFVFKVVEDGHAYVADKDGNAEMVTLKNTKNRNIFMYYVLKDTASLRRFVSDMLKFEDADGNSLLSQEYFMNADVLREALSVISGVNIYIQISKSEKDDGTVRTWQNLISWKRASSLDLPQ